MTEQTGFTSASEFLTFAFSGKAVFTVQNQASGRHLTFKLVRSKREPGTFFATQEGGQSVYLGKVQQHLLHVGIQQTLKSEVRPGQPGDQVLAVFHELMRVLLQGRMPRGLAIQHEGRCGVCSRPLTHPQSLRTGVGPECAAKLGGGFACTALAA